MTLVAFESHMLELGLSLVWLAVGVMLFLFCIRIRSAGKVMGAQSKILGPVIYSGYAGVAAGTAFMLEWTFQHVGLLCWHGPVSSVVGYAIVTSMIIALGVSVRRYWHFLQIIGG